MKCSFLVLQTGTLLGLERILLCCVEIRELGRIGGRTAVCAYIVGRVQEMGDPGVGTEQPPRPTSTWIAPKQQNDRSKLNPENATF